MKKLIITIMILTSTICWADTKDDVFNSLGILDISVVAKAAPGTKIGLTDKETSEFKKATDTFFKDNYLIVKSWTPVDTSSCIAFTDMKTIYAMCLDGKIVVLKEIK